MSLSLTHIHTGADADIALGFHTMREKHRSLFTNRIVNKGWYGAFSAKTMFSMGKYLHRILKIEVRVRAAVV